MHGVRRACKAIGNLFYSALKIRLNKSLLWHAKCKLIAVYPSVYIFFSDSLRYGIRDIYKDIVSLVHSKELIYQFKISYIRIYQHILLIIRSALKKFPYSRNKSLFVIELRKIVMCKPVLFAVLALKRIRHILNDIDVSYNLATLIMDSSESDAVKALFSRRIVYSAPGRSIHIYPQCSLPRLECLI